MTASMNLSSDIWHLAPSITSPDRGHKLDWSTMLPSGEGRRAKYQGLKKALKEFFLARYGPSNQRSQGYGSGTLAQEFRELRRLARWMEEHDIASLSKLEPHDLVLFLLSRRARAHDDKHVAEETLHAWITRFRELWEHRGEYRDALAFDPDVIRDEVLAVVPTRRGRSWPAVDDDVAFKLIQAALHWVSEVGQTLVTLLERRTELHRGWSTKNRTRQKEAVSIVYDEIEKSSEFQILRKALNLPAIRRQEVLSKAVVLTEGACITLLLFLVGLRISELLALQKDCLYYDDPDGHGKIAYLKGTAAKQNGRLRAWVAAKPLDDVISLLIQVNTLKDARVPAVGPLLRSKASIYNARETLSEARRMGAEMAIFRLRRFAQFSLGTKLPIVRKLHPHMARKTFAQLAVRRNKSNLGAISAHLGHVYKSFTDGKYIGTDHTLTRMLEEADRRELAAGLESLLKSQHISGGAANSLRALRARVTQFRGKPSLKALIDKLIKEGVTLAPCDWGFCVYTKSLSACGGNDVGPNEANRSPDVCSGCRNFAVTEEHIHWWQMREKRESEFLKQENLPAQTIELVSRRVEKTRSVLQKAVWARNQGVK